MNLKCPQVVWPWHWEASVASRFLSLTVATCRQPSLSLSCSLFTGAWVEQAVESGVVKPLLSSAWGQKSWGLAGKDPAWMPGTWYVALCVTQEAGSGQKKKEEGWSCFYSQSQNPAVTSDGPCMTSLTALTPPQQPLCVGPRTAKACRGVPSPVMPHPCLSLAVFCPPPMQPHSQACRTE
jgi:hypothetical protein